MTHNSDYYTRMAQDSLERSHERVVQVMEALVQHISFIRKSDVLPEEWEAYQFAQKFIELRKKPMVMEREKGSSGGEVKSA